MSLVLNNRAEIFNCTLVRLLEQLIIKFSSVTKEMVVLIMNSYIPMWHLIRSRGDKTFFMLNSTEHEFFSAHKC